MSIFQDIAKLEKDNFSDAWSEKSLEDTFEYDYNHLLVEKRDGKVVGYVIYSDVQGEAELLRIAVDKAYRRRNARAAANVAGNSYRLVPAAFELCRKLVGRSLVAVEADSHRVTVVCKLYRTGPADITACTRNKSNFFHSRTSVMSLY